MKNLYLSRFESLLTAALILTASPLPAQDLPASISDSLPALAPAALPASSLAAQREAVAKHPTLGEAGSPFHAEFLARIQRRQAAGDTFFKEPRWPILLADEIAAEPPFRKTEAVLAPPTMPRPAHQAIQLAAIEKYPDLGREGSAFNREFLARTRARMAENSPLLQNERWPLLLADEVAAAGFAIGERPRRPDSLPPVRRVARSSSPVERSFSNAVAAPEEAPPAIHEAVAAGNLLQRKPYKWGGGHGSLEDTGYDCSGSVSYVLRKAGLLSRALTSGGFASYGSPGPGRWITIHAGPGHVFMTVCGLRLDTGGRRGVGESGPRWSAIPRYGANYVMRHPPGL